MKAGWALFHGFLGVAILAGLAVALWAALSRPESRMRTLKISTLVVTLAALAKDLIGDILYIAYRSSDPASARSIILASDRPWAHRILMEFKENYAHFLPLLLLVALVMLYAQGQRVRDDALTRRVFVSLLLASLAIAVAALVMGAYIAEVGPLR